MVELPTVDTGVAPFVVVADSAVVEHSALLGHTIVVAEPLGSECTVVSVRTTVVVHPASVVVMESTTFAVEAYTRLEVVVVSPVATVPCEDLQI